MNSFGHAERMKGRLAMNEQQLRVFAALAEKKNFSATARLLHMSQPTVTSLVKTLESELNCRLLDRSTKQVELTDAGVILERYAGQMLNLSRSLRREIEALSETIGGELVVVASMTIGEYVLPPFLGHFKRLYPGIRIHMELMNSHKIMQRIQEDTLAVGLIEAELPSDHTVMQPFRKDKLVLIASKEFESPLLDKDSMTADRRILEQSNLIVREPGSGTRTVMETAFLRAGLPAESFKPYLELGSTEAIKSAVAHNLGVSVISLSALEKEIKLDLLNVYDIRHVDLGRRFYFVHKKNAVLPIQAEAFVKELLESSSLS